jgi:hypothetical protein
VIEPVYTDAAERIYASLPAYLRAADRADGTWPLKRWLSPMLDLYGQVWDVYERSDYIDPGDPGSNDDPISYYTNLVPNSSYEAASPLPSTVVNATAARDKDASWRDRGAWAWMFTAASAGPFGGTVSPQRLVVSPGPVTVSADVRAVNGRTVLIAATCYTAANALISTPSVNVVSSGNGYQPLTGLLVLPAGTASADLSVFVQDGASAGEQLRVDCVQVTVGSTQYPYTPYLGLATGATSALVTPELADDAWLPWLAQLVGVRLNVGLDRQARVDSIRYASAGWRGGTKAAVADAARSALTGTKFVAVYDHSTEAGIGAGGPWDVLLITRLTETPDVSAVLAAVVAKKAKPAGVMLHHVAYNATWAQIVAAYPTWAALAAAGSWAVIEEAGL